MKTSALRHGALWLLLTAGLNGCLGSGPAPVRIGVLHSMTGTMAVSERPLVDAIRLAVEELNAQGGVMGRPIEIVLADGHSNNEIFAEEAERLITEEHVSVLFGCWTSSCRKAVKPVVERHRHLMFYQLQYEGLESSPNILYTGSVPNQQIIPGTRWAFDHLGKRCYLIGSNYIFPRTANIVIRDVASVTNATVLGETYIPLGSTDFSAIVEDIRRLKPDVVLNTINGDSNLAFFSALHSAGLTELPVMSFSVSEPELQAMGPSIYHPNHYAVWSYFQSLDTSANRNFVKGIKMRFGQDRVTSDPMEATYNAVRLWADAAQKASSPEPEIVNRALMNFSIVGLTGVVAIDPGTRHIWKMARVGHALPNGQFEVLFSTPSTLRPAPYPTYRTVEDWDQQAAVIRQKLGSTP